MHYLALCWNDSNIERRQMAQVLLGRARAHLQSWRLAVNHPGLIVLYDPQRHSSVDGTYVLPSEHGVILGRMFNREYAERDDTNTTPPNPVTIDAAASRRIISSGGIDLIEKYWGRYVAFLRNPASGGRWVLRDPTGGIPCQSGSIHGIDVYFVRLQDFETLGATSFTINRHYLAGYLFYGTKSVRATGFNEIDTIMPGERVAYAADQKSYVYLWNPIRIAQADISDRTHDLEQMTRSSVRACVHAWASPFESILLSLSGGLDSSIVLSCLADAPTRPRIECRTLHARGPNSDERTFARKAATFAGMGLIEQEIDTDFQAVAGAQLPRSPFPLNWPLDISGMQKERSFLQSLQVSGLFDGHGGDEIFLRGCSLPGTVDFAWKRGLRPELFALALADAKLDRVSIWKILQLAYIYGLRKRCWHMRSRVHLSHMPLMNVELKREVWRDISHWHPLFHTSGDLPPGKYEHAFLLTHGCGETHVPLGLDDLAINISPLRSQPLIELSLQTPLYLLRAGGVDRSLARRAFARDIPEDIARRRSKAYGNHEFREAFRNNIDSVRELLLDGFLVREKFIEKHKIEDLLSGHASRIQSEITELCSYLAIETWVRSLASKQLQAVG